MFVTSVVGARPQFVKLAPVHAALVARGHEHRIVHTGQHYDSDLSERFFEEFEIPSPDVNLGVGSSSHGRQTAAMMIGLEEHLQNGPCDWVLVYGDTNSTLAGVVVASKLGMAIAHLEAGLRSFNRAMPEELNRVAADHLSDLLLAPTDNAVSHLTREGLEDRTVLVGDVMADVCLATRDCILASKPVSVDEPFLVATIHRQENTDDPARLSALVRLLATAPMTVRLFAHPRLQARLDAISPSPLADAENIEVHAPLGYRELISTLLASDGVMTDSGGLQKEAFLLERPCLTLRDETEWPETLLGGWNRLLGEGASIPLGFPRADLERVTARPFGDGRAALRVVTELEQHDGE